MFSKRRLVIALLALSCSGRSDAQDRARSLSWWIAPASEEEEYLRALQTLGILKSHPWSIRSFSGRELQQLGYELGPRVPELSALKSRAVRLGAVVVEAAPTQLRGWHNTSFPYGINDGAVWAGRGTTVALSTGGAVSVGPIDVTFAPVGFWSENRAFELAPTSGASPFADAVAPTIVDHPQRFGDAAYGRLDLGNSSVRVTGLGLTGGVGTQHEWWGPMSTFPFVLGNNASGFAHAFLGTAQPASLGIGRVHARVIYGRLKQSAYSPVDSGNPDRFAGGAVVVFEPRFLPGLEVGGSRFYQIRWPDSGPTAEYFTHLFESLLKKQIGSVFQRGATDFGSSSDNQLASIFARWVLPASGMEIFAEFGREDHSVDSRDLLLEPDHSAAFGVGARKAWLVNSTLRVLHFELFNFHTSQIHRHRSQGGYYTHVFTRQGHTQRGQLLASPVAVGTGVAAVGKLINDRGYSSEALTIGRAVVREDETTPRNSVQHSIRLEARRPIKASSLLIHAGSDFVYERDRHFSGNALNLRGDVSVVWMPR